MAFNAELESIYILAHWDEKPQKNNPCASVLAMPPIQAREYIQDFLGENSV